MSPSSWREHWVQIESPLVLSGSLTCRRIIMSVKMKDDTVFYLEKARWTDLIVCVEEHVFSGEDGHVLGNARFWETMDESVTLWRRLVSFARVLTSFLDPVAVSWKQLSLSSSSKSTSAGESVRLWFELDDELFVFDDELDKRVVLWPPAAWSEVVWNDREDDAPSRDMGSWTSRRGLSCQKTSCSGPKGRWRGWCRRCIGWCCWFGFKNHSDLIFILWVCRSWTWGRNDNERVRSACLLMLLKSSTLRVSTESPEGEVLPDSSGIKRSWGYL